MKDTRHSLQRFGVSLEKDLLEAFDSYRDAHHYATRSEAIRDLIRERLVRERWSRDEDEVVGTLTLVYDHHAHDLSHELNDIQHRSHAHIVCTTHVHLNAHDCLEVTVLRGTGRQVEDLASRLLAMKGVQHGELVCTSARAGER